MGVAGLPFGDVVTGALSGGLIVKSAGWLLKRGKAKAYTMGAVDHAVQTAMTIVTDRLERVEAQNELCEVHLAKVRDELAIARREISGLMLRLVATYGDADTYE